ncbi:MAG: VWA domain-containing protein [Promethearchaeota archaeon]
MGSTERIEDTVVILDTSRSMMRNDFEPRRLDVAFEIIKLFIQTKFSIDPKDRISILTIGKSPKKIIPFSFDEEQLMNSLERIDVSGKAILHEGISFAIQILVEEMRKVGGKIFRIFVICDLKSIEFNEQLKKIVNIAKGLGIFIDTCQFGKTLNEEKSSLKLIAQLTDGEFGYFNNVKAIINSGKSFASKKTIKESNEFYAQIKEDKTPLISEIALSLRRPSLAEIQMLMSGKIIEKQKCAICHSIKAPLTGADFFTEGRSCPSCDRTMHISCAAQWAKKSELKENIFRCPFCFFLLKVPKSVIALFDDDKISTKRIKIIENEKTTEMISIPEDEIGKIDASCSYCRNIFSNETNVFQCSKCKAYYHETCLNKIIIDIKACRYCGSQITNR